MKVVSRAVVLILITVLSLAPVLPVGAGGGSPNIDWDPAEVARIHHQLWEAKSRALVAQRDAEQMAHARGATSTQDNYDVKFYDIYLRPNDTTSVLYGRVGMMAEATQNNVTDVQIDFYDNMIIDSIVGPSGRLSYSRASNVVAVTLNHAYNTGEQFSFKFYYHGRPALAGLGAFVFTGGWRGKEKVMCSLSEPYFARAWWPCKDRPDDKADSFHIALEVASRFYAASSGALDSITISSPNTKTYFYTERYPMAAYLFSVAISVYTVWTDWYRYNGGSDSMRITNAVYPEMYDLSRQKLMIVPEAIALLAQTYGPYPFLKEKYGNANFEGMAMEHQTMTSLGGISDAFSEPVVVHELAHQWCGDMITCKSWHHVWLNEGFATYSEALYHFNKEGFGSYVTYMSTLENPSGGTIYISDTTGLMTMFSPLVYDKGAWVFHMLRGVLGESLFTAAMKAWFSSSFKYGSATTEDFRDLVEATTGVDLHWFFEDWIYGTYRPTYRWCWMTEPAPDGTSNTYVVIKQVQTTNPVVFRMPVPLNLLHADGTSDTPVLKCDAAKKLFKFNYSSAVNQVFLDPSHWVLRNEMMVPWELFLITTNDELSQGVQYARYCDTVQNRSSSPAANVYSIVSGALPPGLSIDSMGVVGGACKDTGSFAFTVKVWSTSTGYADSAQYAIHVASGSPVAGDVSLDGLVDISDLFALVDYLVNPGAPAPDVLNTADVNGSCNIDIEDVNYLIDYLASVGPAPKPGCVQ